MFMYSILCARENNELQSWVNVVTFGHDLRGPALVPYSHNDINRPVTG